MPTALQREDHAAREIAIAWLSTAESLLRGGKLPTRLADGFWIKIAYHYTGVYGSLSNLAETAARSARVQAQACKIAFAELEHGRYGLVRKHFEDPDGTCACIAQESEPVALLDNHSQKFVGFYTSVYYAVKEREYRRAENSSISLQVLECGLWDAWEVVTGANLLQAENEVLENSKSKYWPRPKPKAE